MTCTKANGAKNDSLHICTGNINVLLIEPKVMRFTLGYLCDSREGKSLKGFRFHFKWLKLSNSTGCQPIKSDSLASGFLQCTKYYKYTTFPNFYGAGSQEEVLNTITLITTTLSTMKSETTGGMCHKDIGYLICQTFLPHCPILETQINSITGKGVITIYKRGMVRL